MRQQSVSALVFWILLHLILPASSSAEDPATDESIPTEENVYEARLPSGMPAIPGPRDRAERYVLNASNAETFHPLLLAPVAEWLEAGMLAMRVISRLDYTWSLGEAWDAQSEENFRQFTLDASGTIQYPGPVAPVLGYPFGNAARIDEEKDPSRRARMILWNLVYSEGAAKDILYEARLAWIGTQSVLRESTGVFYKRLFREPTRVDVQGVLQRPSAEGAKASSQTKAPAQAPTALPKATEEPPPPLTYGSSGDMLGQELLELLSPPVVLGYAHITWRYRGPEQDLVWLHSPVTGSNRQVLSSNRSDPLLGGVLTPDDLLVWSTQVQAVNAKVVDEKVLLLPFAAVTYYLAEPQEAATTLTGVNSQELSAEAVAQAHKEVEEQPKGKPGEQVTTVRGYYQRSDGSYAAAVWNHESGKTTQFAPWVPLTAVLIPRDVWILEITPRDPYYAAGRQILVVDKESMRPFYKVVFDASGEYEKTVAAAWSLAKSKDGSVRFPFAAFVLGVDATGKNAMTFTAQFLRTFQGKDSKLALSLRRLLDIRSHARDAKIGTPEKKPAEDAATKRPAKAETDSKDPEADANDGEAAGPGLAGPGPAGPGTDDSDTPAEIGSPDPDADTDAAPAPQNKNDHVADKPTVAGKAPAKPKTAQSDEEAGGF